MEITSLTLLGSNCIEIYNLNRKQFPNTAGKRNVSYYKVTLNFHEKHFQYTAGKRDISYYKVIHNFNEKHLTYTAEKRNVSVK